MFDYFPAAIISIAALFGCSQLLAVDDEALIRTWTDRHGRQVEAEYLECKDGELHLRRTSDGNSFSVSLDKFSDADQRFVESQGNADSAVPTSTEPFANQEQDTTSSDSKNEDAKQRSPSSESQGAAAPTAQVEIGFESAREAEANPSTAISRQAQLQIDGSNDSSTQRNGVWTIVIAATVVALILGSVLLRFYRRKSTTSTARDGQQRAKKTHADDKLDEATESVRQTLISLGAKFPSDGWVELCGRSFSDDHLALLDKLPSVRHLFLDRSAVTDMGVINHISKLTSLTALVLDDTKITDKCIPAIAKLEEISALQLRGTQITDDCIGVISMLPKLKSLGLSATQISDRGIAKLRHCSLGKLSIERCRSVTDAALPHIIAMPALEKLYAVGSSISDEGVQWAQKQHSGVGRFLYFMEWRFSNL
ncbi:MAG: SHD1 domain-containing protein [Planctomycetota bacterium]|nr:SHD1 domain-containing protein [Planctomycetota bacterium]